jgi:hypothetical protein
MAEARTCASNSRLYSCSLRRVLRGLLVPTSALRSVFGSPSLPSWVILPPTLPAGAATGYMRHDLPRVPDTDDSKKKVFIDIQRPMDAATLLSAEGLVVVVTGGVNYFTSRQFLIDND